MFTLKFEPAEINLVMRALGRQPYDDVAGLINNIAQQANAQAQAQSPVVGLSESPTEAN